MIKNLFLTGDVQVGKSTVINRVIHDLQIKAGGFRTQRHYEKNQITGFYMESLNEDCSRGPFFIGRCGSEGRIAIPETFETVGVSILQECLRQSPDVIVMDELGFFENQACQFQNTVKKCLDSEIPVLGVLKNAGTDFLNSLRNRTDIFLFFTTPDNRESIFNTVLFLLKKIITDCRTAKTSG